MLFLEWLFKALLQEVPFSLGVRDPCFINTLSQRQSHCHIGNHTLTKASTLSQRQSHSHKGNPTLTKAITLSQRQSHSHKGYHTLTKAITLHKVNHSLTKAIKFIYIIVSSFPFSFSFTPQV